MTKLLKIREISSKYDISARALRYYEDMGLINSTRSDDYAYRLYDQNAIKRLEQILILRKLNISIKDIRRIFNTTGSDVVLDVLGKKVENIDEEVALLHDLKDILTEFIAHIRQADFSKDADVKMLYEKASNHAPNKSKKSPEVRIIQINPFRAFSSGTDTIENVMGTFQQWQEEHNHFVKKMMYGAPDFLWFEEDMKATWIWAVEEWVTKEDTAPYEIIEFEGGLYAAAMAIDGDDDISGRIYSGILKWIEDSDFELDERPGHRSMCHMLNPTDEIRNALGYDQLDIYVPIKIRGKEQ